MKKKLLILGISIFLSPLLLLTFNLASKQMCSSRVGSLKIRLHDLQEALDMYAQDCSKYPTTAEGLVALEVQPSSCQNWGPEPYAKFRNPDYLTCLMTHTTTNSNGEPILIRPYAALIKCFYNAEKKVECKIELPRDPWGHELIYESNAEAYRLGSHGAIGTDWYNYFGEIFVEGDLNWLREASLHPTDAKTFSELAKKQH